MKSNAKKLMKTILELQSTRQGHIRNKRHMSAQLVEAKLTRIRSNIESAKQDKAS